MFSILGMCKKWQIYLKKQKNYIRYIQGHRTLWKLHYTVAGHKLIFLSLHFPYFSTSSPLVLLTSDHFLTGMHLFVGGTRADLFLGGASLGLFPGGLLLHHSLWEVRSNLVLFFLGGVAMGFVIEGVQHNFFPRVLRMQLAVACCRSHLFNSGQKIFGSEQQSHCCYLCRWWSGDG